MNLRDLILAVAVVASFAVMTAVARVFPCCAAEESVPERVTVELLPGE